MKTTFAEKHGATGSPPVGGAPTTRHCILAGGSFAAGKHMQHNAPMKDLGPRDFVTSQSSGLSTVNSAGLKGSVASITHSSNSSLAAAAEKDQSWLNANGAALDSSNAYVERNGLPLAKHRAF